MVFMTNEIVDILVLLSSRFVGSFDVFFINLIVLYKVSFFEEMVRWIFIFWVVINLEFMWRVVFKILKIFLNKRVFPFRKFDFRNIVFLLLWLFTFRIFDIVPISIVPHIVVFKLTKSFNFASMTNRFSKFFFSSKSKSWIVRIDFVKIVNKDFYMG